MFFFFQCLFQRVLLPNLTSFPESFVLPFTFNRGQLECTYSLDQPVFVPLSTFQVPKTFCNLHLLCLHLFSSSFSQSSSLIPPSLFTFCPTRLSLSIFVSFPASREVSFPVLSSPPHLSAFIINHQPFIFFFSPSVFALKLDI